MMDSPTRPQAADGALPHSPESEMDVSMDGLSEAVEALHAVRRCKNLALRANRRVFACGLHDAAGDEVEETRADVLQVREELDVVEMRLRAALAEEGCQHARIVELEKDKAAGQVGLAEAQAEAHWLEGALSSTAEQLSRAKDKLYLQVEHEEMLQKMQEALRRAEELHDIVLDRKGELQRLEERCNALEAENAMLRTDVQAGHGVKYHARIGSLTQSSLPVAAASHLPQAQETGRLRKQCDALRTVLRQKEDELGQEKQTTSQLKTAIKVAHSEYVKTLARSRQEVADLQKDRCKHEERVRMLQQHLDDALKRQDAESKSALSLRCLNKSLQDEVHRLRQLTTRERRCLPGESSALKPPESPRESSGSADLISPRGSGADTNGRGPCSPHGPDGERPAMPALQLLQHTAHANKDGEVAASHLNEASDASVLGALSARSQDSAGDAEYSGSTGESSGAMLAARIMQLEKKLEKESAARRADQLAVMEHISGAERDKQRMTGELAARSKMCSQLEAKLAEAQFRASCKNAARTCSAMENEQTAHESGALQEQEHGGQRGQDLFSSLLGVFSLQKPKPPKPGMDSPRGERISGAPESPLQTQIIASPSLYYSGGGARSRSTPGTDPAPDPMLGMQCSPSVAFPLDTIKESSLSPSEGPSPRDAHELANVQSGAGTAGDGAEVDEHRRAEEPAKKRLQLAASSVSESGTERVLILDGSSGAGSHTSIRTLGCDSKSSHEFLTPAEASCQSFDPSNLDWRITL